MGSYRMMNDRLTHPRRGDSPPGSVYRLQRSTPDELVLGNRSRSSECYAGNVVRLIAVALCAGCGRLGFDAPIDSSIGHDEDGDGVPDTFDVCPHIPGPQLDTDHDGVGDDCDPEPTNPRQRIALFAAMTPDDQPFSFRGSGDWTQRADAMHFDGKFDGSMNYGVALQNAQITIGVDVSAVVGATSQHQLALGATPDPSLPHHYVELNEMLPGLSLAAVTHFDGTSYSYPAAQLLSTGLHGGQILLQETALVGTSVQLDGGWPGESYHLSLPTTSYQGTDAVFFVANNLVLDLQYVCIVAWP